MKKLLLFVLLVSFFFQLVAAQADVNVVSSKSLADDAKKISATVYPNPVNDFLKVEVKDIAPESLDMKIFNFIGNSLNTSIETLDNHKYLIKTSDLPKGYYWVVIYNKKEGTKRAFKFSKQ